MSKSMPKPPTLKEWQTKGKYREITLDGDTHQIFVVDSKDYDPIASSKPNLVILHGYPTSIYDYWKALPLLMEKYRVVMHDHIGFGLSDKPTHYSYQLIDQATIALNFWDQLNIKNCHLLAHDYGTSVATEIIHRHNHNEFRY